MNYLGPSDEFVVSGSDDGNLFIWRKDDGKLVDILEGDGEVVNVIEGMSVDQCALRTLSDSIQATPSCLCLPSVA